MKAPRVFRLLAQAALAVLLLAMGAALRPLISTAAPAPVLTQTEIGFVQDMVAHHSQALVLVQRLDPDAGPGVLALATQIADAQRTELGMLLGWLRLADAPVTNAAPMSWMPSAHHAPESHDTGMATAAELDELSAARGTAAEVPFLRLMQRHHYGGLRMAAAADGLLVDGEVKRAARDMITGQGREAGLLGMLLAQRAS
ncbi:DUF305 domain-containing protein [Nocardia sp. AG03]|uniref:DUF305 domain-containing protein n=1 Tax=Nocardia sp. AG03 TaxID=3025312 RepID=UPI0024189218|nr:DUF305 domain-containing protein [Nocardia sp. AG03]